jgi:hypothetical protein
MFCTKTIKLLPHHLRQGQNLPRAMSVDTLSFEEYMNCMKD